MFGFCCNGLWSGGWWGGGWMMILFLIFWLLLIGVGVWLIISVIRRNRQSPSITSAPSLAAGETALDILKARYARGEISREDFENMRRIIAD